MDLWRMRFELVVIVFFITTCRVSSISTEPPDTTEVTSSQDIDILSLRLQKCHCDGDHVLDGSVCKAKSNVIKILELPEQKELMFNTSEFSSLHVEEVVCVNSHIYSVVKFASEIILFSGQLILVINNKIYKEYCIEHVSHNGDTYWEAHICLPPPSVPKCCPRGHYLASDDSCLPDNSSLVLPSLQVGNVSVQWIDVNRTVDATCEGGSVVRRLNLSAGEGSLVLSDPKTLLTWKTSSDSHTEQEYCVDMEIDTKNNDTYYIAKFCYLDVRLHHQVTCSNNTCVRKCCEKNSIVDARMCLEAQPGEKWEPTFHVMQNRTSALAAEDWVIVEGLPFCENFFVLEPYIEDNDKFYLQTDGFIYIPHFERSYSPRDYCIDHFLDENGLVEKVLLCSPETPEDVCYWKTILVVVLLGISCVFLAATLGVYLGVAELRDRTYGRCLISMVTAMLSAYISLIVNNQVREQSDTQCIIRAFIGHVCSLATFFWLNVMCYDMWSTLRSSQQKHHSKKTFLKYSLYAWGCPLIVGAVALIIDSLKQSNLIRPRFTDGTCWFHGDAEYWLYLSGIIFILVMVNIIFFIHVAVTLARDFKQRKSTFDTNTSHSSKSTKTREQAWLYIKLFIVMGIVWIAEAISSVQHRNTCTFWVLADIINGLQGVFIFIVTVCSKDNIKKIRDAWRPRLQTVRKTAVSFKGRTSTGNANRRGTDLSLAASESSRKTSLTSLPRKFSVASSVFHPACSKAKRATTLSDTSETSRKSPNLRKISIDSNPEVIPMTNIMEI